MLLNKQDKKYKEYLRMEKELSDLREKLYKLPLIPLPEPYQKGWLITIKLRDDIANRKDANDILKAIEIGYYKERFTNSVDEVKSVRAGKKSYSKIVKKKRITTELVPSFRYINEKKYIELPDNIRKYFYLDVFNESYKKYGHKLYQIKIPYYYITLRVKPNMITHTRQKGGELEERYEFLKHKLEEFWREKYNYSKTYPRSKQRTETRDDIRKFIKGEVEDIYIKKIPLEYKH